MKTNAGKASSIACVPSPWLIWPGLALRHRPHLHQPRLEEWDSGSPSSRQVAANSSFEIVAHRGPRAPHGTSGSGATTVQRHRPKPVPPLRYHPCLCKDDRPTVEVWRGKRVLDLTATHFVATISWQRFARPESVMSSQASANANPITDNHQEPSRYCGGR